MSLCSRVREDLAALDRYQARRQAARDRARWILFVLIIAAFFYFAFWFFGGLGAYDAGRLPALR